VGESYRFHRMEQMIDVTLARLEKDRAGMAGGDPRRLVRRMQCAFLRSERRGHLRCDARVKAIDDELYPLEERQDQEAVDRKRTLNRVRDRAHPRGGVSAVARRVPFLRRYRRPLDITIRSHVVELLRTLGIPNPENVARRYPHELSGGMQQRIVIAMALACHPTLLVADEPTSNLDVTIQAQIVELIKDLKRTAISSVLFITHDLGLVAEVCDRVTVMYAGDVSETASVKALFRNPLHPYSQGLLASVPKVEQAEELSMIPGAVPNLIQPPQGCRFHPRCPRRMDICAQEKPATVEHEPGHWVACHLYPGSGRSAP
ncbi:MAG TPA: ABC transporter ATP-binding protein, partial [bacterium]|nr:ABC transporter ATP-binding protein [bacterium]